VNTAASGGNGVVGTSNATSGSANGVYGSTASPAGSGVVGLNSATSGEGWGVYGASQSPQGYGVAGVSSAANGAAWGVWGFAASTSGVGVEGSVNAPNGIGVVGINDATSGLAIGLEGFSNSPNGVAISGSNPNGLAGSFDGGVSVTGDVSVTGNLKVTGTLTKGGGSFKIDHPLDPANKYLSHSFVESPDMMNIYNGNVTTSERGLATVVLPDYFEALNGNFRYQLTVIGQFAQAIVAEEIGNGRFTIKTNRPKVKVSWQVTGIRHDAYANAHRIPVTEQKPSSEQGTYLHPDLYGQGAGSAVSGGSH
jgi:hypothetical protein